MAFSYSKIIQFYDTDAMGIVHHANYLRYFEEARVAWLRDMGLLREHAPFSSTAFAVLKVDCQYKKICRFGEDLEIHLEVRVVGRAQIEFQYAARRQDNGELIATGNTLHVAMDDKYRVGRIPEKILAQIESETWTEIWP